MQFVLHQFKTHEMCVEGVNGCCLPFGSVLDWCKMQEMDNKVVSKNFFILKKFLDKYKSQEMCGKLLIFFYQHWNLFFIGLLQVRWLKILMMIYSLMM